jgi:hypothetical protein
MTEKTKHRGKWLFKGFYYSTSSAKFLNTDHCIDQLRQYVMCSADLTTYGTRYFESLGRNYADTDVKHVCRDFGKIRDWVRRRNNGDLAVYPEYGKHVDIIPADKKIPLI